MKNCGCCDIDLRACERHSYDNYELKKNLTRFRR